MCIVISKSFALFDISVLPKIIHNMTFYTKNMCFVISESLVSFDVSVLPKIFHTMTI